jgi:hypothetical protein
MTAKKLLATIAKTVAHWLNPLAWRKKRKLAEKEADPYANPENFGI